MCGWRIKSSASAVFPWTLCVLGLLYVPFTGCTKREASADSSQVLRISQRNEPATLDPQLATLPDEFFIIRALSQGLVTPNPAGDAPLPAAASRWETSPDGLTWTFHLEGNSLWSNGDPVTARDFVYTIHRALTPATAAPKAALFFALKGAQDYLTQTITEFDEVGAAAPDDRTLVLTLTRPTADFLALVASGPWIPVHRATVEKFGRDWTSPAHFVGNGPFTLAEWSPNQRIVVQKNPRYRSLSPETVSTIQFLAFDNGETEERAFRAGQVDVTMAVPSTKLAAYRHANPPVLLTVPLYETRYLAVNMLQAPLSDARVRRALSLALDRAALVNKVLKAGQLPAFTFLPQGLSRHEPTTRVTENAAEARRLLADAGFPGGRGFPKLELTTWPVSTPQLEAIQQMWHDQLGIDVAIVQREAKAHLAALAASNFDLAFATIIPDYDSATDVLARFTTGDAGNYPHWTDPDYDRLVAAGGAELAKAESRLLTELPVIPLYFNTKNFLLRPTVRGWKEDALWTRYYENVSLEK